MTNELDEWLPHRLSHHGMRRQNVGDREEWKQHPDSDDLERLKDHVLATETWKTFVPKTGQQLLHIRVGDELKKKEF